MLVQHCLTTFMHVIKGGTFIIRIEDTDRKRHVEDGERSQLDNLRWLGIDWDESPETHENYRQSERLPLYQKYIGLNFWQKVKPISHMSLKKSWLQSANVKKRLVKLPRYINEFLGMTEEEKAAYIAEREAAGIVPTVCLGWLMSQEFINGMISLREISNLKVGNIGGDWVIQKKDGYPTYNFAVVVDDHDMQISHVIRGDDHIANTPKQLMVYEALGWEAPEFGHT